ncbi:THUMP domain-containing protein 1 homolog [Stomoxys calcitrans]|uniref:THUMP domain-containing protein 1 homolog n=1 Tax=Stomoxys calcitrans TaxID=35570 RepID=UPI0027E317D7|nr:THUMP domain-containing protein 1 homolog [Stomoxys calcitrans]
MSAHPAKKAKFQNKKKFYQPSRKQYLEAGHKGFIATCNFNEKDCVRECYNILNQYADDLYGPEDSTAFDENNGNKQEDKKDIEVNTDDIADELQKQIDATQQKSKGSAKRRFQVVDTGATNCVFIKTTLPDPNALASRIVKDIAETRKQKTRYLLRLVPIEIVCKANNKDIVDSAGLLSDKHFLNEPTTFSIVFNKRFNNDISRDGLIKELADIIHAKNIKHKVDLKYANKSLIVEVIKGLCCLSVVDNYMGMKKYNLVELGRQTMDNDKNSIQAENVLKSELIIEEAKRAEDGAEHTNNNKEEVDNNDNNDNKI